MGIKESGKSHQRGRKKEKKKCHKPQSKRECKNRTSIIRLKALAQTCCYAYHVVHVTLTTTNSLANVAVLCLLSHQLCICYYSGDLLTLLNVSSDGNILPTTYGELRPPLGKHRLKVGFC